MNILVYNLQGICPTRGGIERMAQVLGNRFSADGHVVSYLSGDCSIEEIKRLVQEQDIQIILNHEANDLYRTTILHQAIVGKNIPLVSVFHLSPTHCVDCFKASFFDICNSGLSWQDRFLMILRNTKLYRIVYSRYFGRCYAKISEMSDAIVLLSEKYRIPFQYIAELQNTSQIHCIPNFLTIPPISASPVRKKKIVLFVARLTFHEKRPDLMLQIWQRVCTKFPDWSLHVIGDGHYRPALEQCVLRRNIRNVQFLGHIDAADYYSEASIICSTSSSEGQPLVLSEAASHFVVPMCFDSFASVSDIIRDGETGFVVPSFDVEAYATKLSLLMHDENLRKSFGAAAKDHILTHFAPDLVMPRWYQLLSQLHQQSSS